MLHPVIIKRPQMRNFVIPRLRRLLFLLKQMTPPLQHLAVRYLRWLDITRIMPESSDNLVVAPFSGGSQPVSKKIFFKQFIPGYFAMHLILSIKFSAVPCKLFPMERKGVCCPPEVFLLSDGQP